MGKHFLSGHLYFPSYLGPKNCPELSHTKHHNYWNSVMILVLCHSRSARYWDPHMFYPYIFHECVWATFPVRASHAPLESDAWLGGGGYAVRQKCTFHEVDELITNFIFTCNDKSVIFEVKWMMYRERLGTTVNFFLEVGGEGGML